MLPPPAEGSADVAARVGAARALQQARYAGLGQPEIGSNAAAPANLIEEVARPDRAGQALVREASERLQLSARGYHRVLKLARTIADLDGAETVASPHVAEALSYRADHSAQGARARA
jgi:magnesium chelatase family protein